MPDDVRNLNAPLRAEDLAPLGRRCRFVQLHGPLSDGDYRSLGELLASYPLVTLRVASEATRDLEFLRYFPSLRRLHFDLLDLRSVEGLNHLPRDLIYLGWGATRSGRGSLKVLQRFRRLRQLALEGQQRDLEVIGELRQLRELTLRSVRLPDLTILQSLARLRRLHFLLGGNLDLAPLRTLHAVEALSLLRVRGLADLSPLAGMAGLQELTLHDLPKVTALPSLARLAKLRRVEIQNLKNLRDLSPLAEAPVLEEVRLYAMRHSDTDVLTPLLGRPSLRRSVFLFGSEAKSAEARRRFAHREKENA